MIDQSTNQRDMQIEFLQFAPIKARYVQVKIVRGNDPMLRGLSDLAVFVKPRRIYPAAN